MKPSMTTIPVTEAVGTILCHDITRIVPGESKGAAFRKGHVVTAEDIPELLKLGKENLYVWQAQPGMLHENEAAARLAHAALGTADPDSVGLALSSPVEGKITCTAARQGLLRVNIPLLNAVNNLGDIAFATRHSLREAAPGEAVAGVRVIPLTVPESLMAEAERLCAKASAPLLSVLPFRPFRVGMIITGSEVYHGRIQDGFGPVLRKKFAALGSSILDEIKTPDDVEPSRAAILSLADAGADMIVLTGGMSVDPDDRTPAAIRASGATVVAYGAPVLPGAMFLLARLESARGAIPVLGLPGCVMYHRASIFDLIVPRLLAGVDVTAEDIAGLGHGGFCANCPDCRYPCCPFGA